MANLPPYNSALCAKCGGSDALTRYCVGLPEDIVDASRVIASRGLSSWDRCTVLGEHHHRVCHTCGYAWEESVWEGRTALAEDAPPSCAVQGCEAPVSGWRGLCDDALIPLCTLHDTEFTSIYVYRGLSAIRGECEVPKCHMPVESHFFGERSLCDRHRALAAVGDALGVKEKERTPNAPRV